LSEVCEKRARKFLNLKCGRLEQGFLRVRFDACHTEKLVAFSASDAAFARAAAPGA